MTPTSGSTRPQSRVYSRYTASQWRIGAGARGATHGLAPRNPNGRELAEVARWEGDGGATGAAANLEYAAPERSWQILSLRRVAKRRGMRSR